MPECNIDDAAAPCQGAVKDSADVPPALPITAREVEVSSRNEEHTLLREQAQAKPGRCTSFVPIIEEHEGLVVRQDDLRKIIPTLDVGEIRYRSDANRHLFLVYRISACATKAFRTWMASINVYPYAT